MSNQNELPALLRIVGAPLLSDLEMLIFGASLEVPLVQVLLESAVVMIAEIPPWYPFLPQDE